MKNKTLEKIVEDLIMENNYTFDEIIAEIAVEVDKILDEDYLEEY